MQFDYIVKFVGVYIPETKHSYEPGQRITGEDARLVEKDSGLMKRVTRTMPLQAAAPAPPPSPVPPPEPQPAK